MPSFALDLTTIGHALNALLEEGIGKQDWEADNAGQKLFLDWYETHRDEIARLDGLNAKASPDFQVLNAFLTAHGFEPKFEQFDGIGVVSILDMLVEWLTDCTTTTITEYDHSTKTTVHHPAFSVPADGAMVYMLTGSEDGFGYPLVELRTKSGHSLWLREAPEPKNGLDLAGQAQSMLTAPRQFHPQWTAGVTVPMLDMDLDTDLDWLLGFATPPDWFITQANQQFKLRANEKGARVKVATSLVVTRSISLRPEPLVFREPFIGCFTQPGHPDIALAAFWADTDSWRNPEGTLEEL